MKHQGCWALGLGVLTLALVASPAAAQTAANGPYYATPSWDQQLPASTRFIVLSNWGSAAVLDRETGLVWERVPSTDELNWFGGQSHCINLNTGGRTGWRLPTVQELLSLVDRTASNPSLPSGHPFNVQSSNYWSATRIAFNPTAGAWGVNLGNGIAADTFENGAPLFVWCVRGGQGAEAQ